MVTEVIAVVVAALSAGVAIWAKVDSGRANDIARDAVEKASHANEISLESNSISRKGNEIAVAANKLAEETNAVAQASGLLQTERNDVDWEATWERYGVLQLVNVGRDPALNVHAVVTIEGVKREGAADVVGDPLKFNFKNTAVTRRAEGAVEARGRNKGNPLIHFSLTDAGVGGGYRATWESELGQHHSDERMLMFTSDEVLGE